MDDVLVGKVTISASLKKINFLKISEQAPLRFIMPRHNENYMTLKITLKKKQKQKTNKQKTTD